MPNGKLFDKFIDVIEKHTYRGRDDYRPGMSFFKATQGKQGLQEDMDSIPENVLCALRFFLRKDESQRVACPKVGIVGMTPKDVANELKKMFEDRYEIELQGEKIVFSGEFYYELSIQHSEIFSVG